MADAGRPMVSNKQQQLNDHQRIDKLDWHLGRSELQQDQVAAEVAVALVYNGISHVVMMLTPNALEEFALGFSLSEGIIQRPDQFYGIELIERDQGLELAIEISAECFAALKQQRRNLTGRTGCGLCGAESLQQAISAPQPVGNKLRVCHEAIERALSQLDAHQKLQRQTGAVHGACWCDQDGNIRLIREDVGRHNALDKLLGAYYRANIERAGEEDQGFNRDEGFILISSRASYEMVTKAASAGVELLVAVSAPTSLAITHAEQCGITLVGFARPGRHAVYTRAQRLLPLQT